MKIMIVDPQVAFRECLRAILEREGFTITGEAGDGAEALRQVGDAVPDIVVLDMNAPLLSAVDVTREIRKRGLPTKVVALVVFKDAMSVMEAFRAGIKAYVLKADIMTDLVLAIRKLHTGNSYLSPGVTELVVKKYLHHKGPDTCTLTPREAEILQLIAHDSPVAEIAKQLDLTIQVVEAHRTAMMDKIKASSISGLVRHAVRQGYIRA